MSADLSRLLDLVEAFPRQTVVVLGDFVADEFVFGEIARVSREAPVLILRHRQSELVPGGGANAANNLADLGARVLPVGIVGDDAAGEALVNYFRHKRVDTSGIIRLRGWTTTTKTRFLAGWTHSTRQQVLRVDREPAGLVPGGVRAQLARNARRLARRSDAVLVSDYGLGVVTPQLVRQLPRKLITLDSRYALLSFRNLRVAAATPNESELEALYHTRIGNDRAKLDHLGAQTLRKLGLRALVATRGRDGMVVFERGHAPAAIPVFGTDQVADVTGAGDTVIAVFTVALAAGATFYEAARLANYAGGIVVMKRGTATATREELESAIRSEATGSR